MLVQTLRTRRPTLTDLLPRTFLVQLAIVFGYAGLIGIFAQISIPLPFTPVPLTGQTFAVLLGGAALGWRRAAAGGLIYLALGVIGLPWFAGGSGGVAILTAPTFGYLVGFAFAGTLVGWLAAHGLDRSPITTALTMAAGTIAIYAFGVSVLAFDLHLSLTRAVALGVTPFLIGDLIKLILAAGLLPGTWFILRLTGEHR
ncbi:MAG: biotin transporter BioY [Ferrimicrobium sp.]